MMFGHIETIAERFEHLVMLRDVQEEKPKNAKGFLAFIPWPFQDEDTILKNIKGIELLPISDRVIHNYYKIYCFTNKNLNRIKLYKDFSL